MNLRTLAAATAMVSALTLTACSGATPSASNSAAPTSEMAVSVGITQIVAHPSLDASVEGFKAALEEAGYQVTYDEQNAQGDQQTAATIAGNFANADLDLVLAVATPTAQAAVQSITDTPILFTAVTDPAGAGLVASMDAPGANASGTSDAPPVAEGANPTTEQLQLIKDLIPDAATVGIVYNSGEANSVTQVDWAKEAAPDLGLEIAEATVTSTAEVQQAAESLDVDAFYVITDNTVVSALASLVQVAETKKIPAIAAEGNSVTEGSAAAMGISYYDLGHQTGEMAVTILSGEGDPATMPVESAPELKLFLNIGAAERMGLVVPQEMIDQADPMNVTE
ncbi:MAG: ABC transporter substrate-binding protein [Propioniciclava sp.]